MIQTRVDPRLEGRSGGSINATVACQLTAPTLVVAVARDRVLACYKH